MRLDQHLVRVRVRVSFRVRVRVRLRVRVRVRVRVGVRVRAGVRVGKPKGGYLAYDVGAPPAHHLGGQAG